MDIGMIFAGSPGSLSRRIFGDDMTERYSNEPPTHPTEPDDLSPLTATILRSAPPDTYTSLLAKGPTPATARAALDGVRPEQLLTAPIMDEDDAKALLAGLWLWHDALHEAHAIVQDLASPTSSFWHAILHR